MHGSYKKTLHASFSYKRNQEELFTSHLDQDLVGPMWARYSYFVI